MCGFDAPSIHYYYSHSLCLSPSLFVCLSVSICPSLCLSVSLSLCVSSLCLSVSVCLSVCLCLSLCVSLCLCSITSPSWARAGCKTSLCLLHYTRKIKCIHSFIHSFSLCVSASLCLCLSLCLSPLCSLHFCVHASTMVGRI